MPSGRHTSAFYLTVVSTSNQVTPPFRSYQQRILFFQRVRGLRVKFSPSLDIYSIPRG